MVLNGVPSALLRRAPHIATTQQMSLCCEGRIQEELWNHRLEHCCSGFDQSPQMSATMSPVNLIAVVIANAVDLRNTFHRRYLSGRTSRWKSSLLEL
jgi:hypothetical protein